MRIRDLVLGAKVLGLERASFYAMAAPADGTTNASTVFASAITSGKTIKFYAGTYRLNSNHTPATILDFTHGGKLKPNTGTSVNLTGSLILASPGQQIFDISLGGTITGNPDIECVYPTWWGADPTYINDSAAAMQAWLDFCVGNSKPQLRLVPGRYKLIGTATTGPLLSIDDSGFQMPMISGVPGGSRSAADGYKCVLDASASNLTADANGNYPPIIKLKGASGTFASGGCRDLSFVGNGTCGAVQIADAGGLIISNIRVSGCVYGVEIYNETSGTAPTTTGQGGVGGGFAENNCIRDSYFSGVSYAFKLRRFCDAGFTHSATSSFHKTDIEHCWVNLSGNNACAVYVGAGCEMYNSTVELQVFFTGMSASLSQYVFGFEPVYDARMPAITVKCGGRITTEGSSGSSAYGVWAGPFNQVFWTGEELSLGGMRYGNMVPCSSVTKYGSESSANGTAIGVRRKYSVGPRSLANGGTIAISGVGAGRLFIELLYPNYVYRYQAVFYISGQAGINGRIANLDSWQFFDGTGWGGTTTPTMNDAGVITLGNASWPPRSASSAVKSGGNVGNGTLTLDATLPVGLQGFTGVYEVRCVTADASGGGTFTIRDPNGFFDTNVKSVGGGNISSPYLVMAAGAGSWNGTVTTGTALGSVKFTIAAGATPFAVGDGFDITVVGGISVYYAVDPIYLNRSQVTNFNTMYD